MGLKSFIKKYGISLVILGLVIYFIKDKISLSDFANAFSKANFAFYALGIVVLIMPLLLRAYKYHLYLGKESPGMKELLKMVFFSIYFNSTLPARAGDILSIVYLKGKNVEMSKATGSVLAERATDIIWLLLFVFTFSFFLGPEMGTIISDAIKLASVLIIVLLLMVVVVLWKKKFVAKIANRIKLLKEFDFESFLIKFEEGMKLLIKSKKIAGLYFVIISPLRWILEAPNYYFIMLAAGIIISNNFFIAMGYALFYLCIVGLLWSIPLTPGGLGTVEAFSFLFFAPFGIPESTIITFIVLIRTMLLVYIIPGIIFTNKISGNVKEALSKERKKEIGGF